MLRYFRTFQYFFGKDYLWLSYISTRQQQHQDFYLWVPMRDKIEGTLFFLSKINMFCKLSEIHLLKQFRFVSLMFSSIWCLQERGRMERKEEEKLKKEKLICFVSPSTLYLTRPLQLTQALWLQSVLVVILMMILRWSTEFRFDCSVDRISSSVGQIFESLKFLTRVISWWWWWWLIYDDCSDDNQHKFAIHWDFSF